MLFHHGETIAKNNAIIWLSYPYGVFGSYIHNADYIMHRFAKDQQKEIWRVRLVLGNLILLVKT